MTDRYADDVLASGWQRARRPRSPDHAVTRGLVVEDASTGFCGAVTRWENGLVVLEDRHGKRRSFGFGAGFLLDGKPVTLRPPPARAARRPAPPEVSRAKVALPSRIYVEGRHDAELVEKVWGDDLRHVGVVVEHLGGIDDLAAIVADFAPRPGRRLGVLVDHLVPGSKETRIAEQVRRGPGGSFVLVTGHPFVDIWQAVKPARLGLPGWPTVPRDQDWKHGVCDALGWPHRDQADVAAAWARILAAVRGWTDLERELLTQMEVLIDFVTQDHLATDD